MKWYILLARHDNEQMLASMNYGYIDDNSKATGNEPVKTQLALYEHVLNTISLKNKTVVEINSGRGEGAAFLTTKYHPKLYMEGGSCKRCQSKRHTNRRPENYPLYYG